MMVVNHLADRVRNERLARGWSVRRAASLSGGLLSNTWWAKFEDGQQPLTDGIRQGVAASFGWQDDWHLDVDVNPLDELAARVEALALALEAVLTWMVGLAELGADVSTLPDVAELTRRVAQ